ncbi:MAG: hypothetical protein V1734_06705 [Nanoarchaeota archaeon]
MKKAGLILAALLAGCSMQNAPVQTAQPSAAQHVWNPPAHEYNAPLCNDCPRVSMDKIFYTIECSDYSFSHTEGMDGCTERLLFETEQDRKRIVDYGCDGTIDRYWHWNLVDNGSYTYYRLVEESSPATEEQADEYNQKLEEIGQPQVDAKWRFRYHV